MLHRRGRDVRGHAHPNEVIHDEAVEKTAEKVLGRDWQRRAQAEQRVSGYAPRGKHSGDEREAIGRAGDVTIRQARPAVSRGVEQAPRLRDANAVLRRADAWPERLDVLPLHDGKLSGAGGLERVPVVGGVQLASETGRPPGVAAKRWKERRSSFGDRDVNGRT